MNHRILPFILGALLTVAGTAFAAPPSEETQKVIDELRNMAAKARKERAADPWLLRAMDDLVQKYHFPWRHSVVDEKFSDGDYTKNPAWEPVSGKFWVDRSLGLRSRAVPPAPTASTQERDKKFKDALREAILAEMAGQRGSATTATPSSSAEIHLPAKITNAFALDTSFSQHGAPSEAAVIEFGLFEGTRRDRGYVLAIVTGAESYAELQRITGQGVAIIEREMLAAPPDTGDVQKLSWRREPNGAMTVMLNDKALMQTADKGLMSPFKSLGIANRGGDFAIRHVTLADAGS